MSDLLPFLIAGLTTGAVYGLAGVGLVLTYKTSGVFNFAHGAVATVAAYVFYVLNVSNGLPWPVAAAGALLVAGPLLGLGIELIARAIQPSSLTVQVAATVGLLLVIASAIQLIFPTDEIRTVPVFLASGDLTVAGTIVQWADLVTFVCAAVVTAVLAVFFRRSRAGLQMRAVVDDPALLAMMGTSPVATRRTAWMLGCTLAAASGVLFAPLLPLDPITLTLLVVAAFGAAAIGAFSSLPVTFGGGLLIGVLASLATKWFTSGPLAGLPVSLPFVVLFAVLLVFPRRRLAARVSVTPRQGATWVAPRSMRIVGSVALLVLLSLVPAFAGIHLTDWTVAVAIMMVFVSLSLLVKTSGQVSLCHVSFMAVGAATFSHLAADRGVPWLAALLLSGLVAVPIGAVLAVPAIRLGGIYLALATFGFGLLLQGMLYAEPYMFGDSGLGLLEPRPDFLPFVDATGDRGYYYLVLVATVLAMLLVGAVTHSRLGRLLRGVADSPLAVETSGADARVTRVLVFCLSAFLAAVGGALAAVAQSTASADSYQPVTSLLYFVVAVLVAGRGPWSAFLCSAGVVLVPSYVSGGSTPTVLQMVLGALVILVAVVPVRRVEAPPFLRRLVERAWGSSANVAREQAHAPAHESRPRVGAGSLEVKGLTVTFGGLVAVSSLDLVAPTGQVTGLIGPNGAGKSTTFNAVSGIVRPTVGAVALDGSDVTRRSPSARARRGLGRTFQKMELLESQSVRANVAMGAEAAFAGLFPTGHVLSRPGDARRVKAATDEALQLCGVLGLQDEPVHVLSTGQRRLVELARCLAGDFRVILMDEPSSGLDRVETERFGEVLRKVVDERGIGILLVEHDMSLVLEVCAQVHVLDFGRLVFSGTPAELVASPLVRSAYLGDAGVVGAPKPNAAGAMA